MSSIQLVSFAGLGFGAICMLLGFYLVVRGIGAADSESTIKLVGIEIRTSKVGPGVLFALFGLVLTVFSIQQAVSASSAPKVSPPASTGAATPAPSPAGVAPPAPQDHPNASSPCSEANGLICLPRSSAAVSFRDGAAANRAAYENLQNGLSTSQGAAVETANGARGHAARLCGILQSNDSSPLAKHMAAVRINSHDPADGQASGPCIRLAGAFL